MTAPTPVTMKIIERLSGSRVSPNGTENAAPRSIQEQAGAESVPWTKIMQAQAKLPSAAPTETNPLRVRIRRVAIVMIKADASGRRRASQGTITKSSAPQESSDAGNLQKLLSVFLLPALRARAWFRPSRSSLRFLRSFPQANAARHRRSRKHQEKGKPTGSSATRSRALDAKEGLCRNVIRFVFTARKRSAHHRRTMNPTTRQNTPSSKKQTTSLTNGFKPSLLVVSLLCAPSQQPALFRTGLPG